MIVDSNVVELNRKDQYDSNRIVLKRHEMHSFEIIVLRRYDSTWIVLDWFEWSESNKAIESEGIELKDMNQVKMDSIELKPSEYANWNTSNLVEKSTWL